jgi:hypothetical protein
LRSLLAESERIVVSALHLTAGDRTAARHVHHIADHGARCAMQAVARDRHGGQLLPGVCLGIVRFIGAEYFAGCLAAEHDDFAVDVNT